MGGAFRCMMLQEGNMCFSHFLQRWQWSLASDTSVRSLCYQVPYQLLSNYVSVSWKSLPNLLFHLGLQNGEELVRVLQRNRTNRGCLCGSVLWVSYFGSGHISWFMSSSPALGGLSTESLLWILCLPPSLPRLFPRLMLFLSFSLKNK